MNSIRAMIERLFPEKKHEKLYVVAHDCIDKKCHYWGIIGENKNKCPNWDVYILRDRSIGYCKIQRNEYYARNRL